MICFSSQALFLANKTGLRHHVVCGTAPLLEPIFTNKKCRIGDGFFSPNKAKTAGILDVFRGFLTQVGGKITAETVVLNCEYRFLTLFHYICLCFSVDYTSPSSVGIPIESTGI